MNAAKPRLSISVQIIILLAICLGLIAIGYILGIFKPTGSNGRVTLKVTSTTGYASITYSSPNQTVKDPTNVSTPWQMSMQLQSGSEVYLTAGNPMQSGDITCTLVLDNQVWKQDSATYPNDKVACAGIVP